MRQINSSLIFIYTIGGRVCSFLRHEDNQMLGWVVSTKIS